ncbi:MAG TPA: argininosuccinate lyase [Bacteroidia bacterium]|nr:argininosuccinate lyase [Bacteroidia bacterium]
MKIWQKEGNITSATTALINDFTVGKDREFDLQLAEFDVLGSLAHTQMLQQAGLLSEAELSLIHQELNSILTEIKSGAFEINEEAEDIHSQMEWMLTQRIGEAGKKIHSGRSRNDQVLLDVKLYLRSELKSISRLVMELFDVLQYLSETHRDKFLPGYTHLQVAMPSSFGLWFGAYAESLTDDMEMVEAAYRICNKNPLGSGAGYGSSFPLNRELTTKLLGFEQMNYNVVYAQMTRGKSEKSVAVALSTLAATLSKLAYDICLYMSQNFGFISFPEELTTGSSIMPHKKNPDVLELVRAKCNRIQSVPNELTLLINNLPSGYHRDLQLTKEILFPAIGELKSCLHVTAFTLRNIRVESDLLKDERYRHIFSVERVNELVLKGISFRDAYKQVGAEIASGTFMASGELLHTHEGSMGNLCTEEIKCSMSKFLFLTETD